MTIVRDDIPVETVYGEMLDGNIAIFKLHHLVNKLPKSLKNPY